jgi:SAM-dependent methyltransferase
VDSTIADYYDRLAPDYDRDRFSNSYGQFLDRQERAIISRMLPRDACDVLDLGCGTGRLSNFATQGCDASAESIRVAKARHPDKDFTVGDATALPFAPASFDAAICFHVLMHLDRATIAELLANVARVLRPGGVFVVDIPSAARRRLVRRRPSGWHGDTSLTRRDFAELGRQAGLRLDRTVGIAMTPIHRVPSRMRRAVDPLDRILCAMMPDLASYMAARFVKDSVS